jgi:HNH endonuclease/NUMOD4 motif
MTEVWNMLKFSDHLYISSEGRVKSINRLVSEKNKKPYTVKGRIYKNRITPNGYNQVCLRVNNQNKYFYVHRLVAEYFIYNYDSSLEVNHIDGNKLNNSVFNLEMTTKKDNMKHATATRLMASGANHGHTTLSSEDVLEIKRLHQNNCTIKDLAKQYNIKYHLAWSIINNKTWKYLKEVNND